MIQRRLPTVYHFFCQSSANHSRPFVKVLIVRSAFHFENKIYFICVTVWVVVFPIDALASLSAELDLSPLKNRNDIILT